MKADALDGLILITQYDIPWRADLFQSWHFYDISQCMEFKRNGYYAGVLSQELPYCMHFCGVSTMQGYDAARMIFLREYADDLRGNF